jgi:hypothetical protein
MNTHWHPDFDSGANGCFIEVFAAPGHVNDLFSKAVMFWPAVSFSTMVLPGVNSVIVPVPSVVVVVVVVCDTCAHANGAANANAMLNITFFIFPFLFPNLPTPNRSNLPHHQSVTVLRGEV